MFKRLQRIQTLNSFTHLLTQLMLCLLFARHFLEFGDGPANKMHMVAAITEFKVQWGTEIDAEE